MGDCSSLYRNVLREQKHATQETVDAAFRNLSKGDIKPILVELKRTPGLINQQQSDHKATLLISALFELKEAAEKKDKEKFQNLKGFIGEIIRNHQEYKLDLTGVDGNNNTAFHRAFWQANTASNPALAEIFLEIGINLLKAVGNAASFSQILGIQNKYNETFLHNIFVPTKYLSQFNIANLQHVQRTVAPVLEKFKRKKDTPETKFEFKEKPFQDYLSDFLTDSVLFIPLTDPYISPDGYTLNLETWKQLPKQENPFTGIAFKEKDLRPNLLVKEIIAIYDKNSGKPQIMCQALSRIVEEQKKSILAEFKRDQTVEDITDLVKAYIAYEKIEELQKKFNVLIDETIQTIKKLHPKEAKPICEKLIYIRDWINDQKDINEEKNYFLLNLIWSTCFNDLPQEAKFASKRDGLKDQILRSLEQKNIKLSYFGIEPALINTIKNKASIQAIADQLLTPAKGGPKKAL